MRISALLFVVSLTLTACANDPGTGPRFPGQPDPGTPAAGATAEQQALQAAHAVPDTAYQTAVASAQIGVTSALVASRAQGGGSLVTTGTVTYTSQSASYDPAPADHLVAVLTDGRRIDFTFSQLVGDLSGDADQLIDHDHLLDFHAAMDGVGDLHLQSGRQNGGYQAAAEGSLIIGGVSYQIDLGSRGSHQFENDSTGGSYDDQYQTTGSVRAPDFDLTVDESWQYKSVWTTGSGSHHASTAIRTVNSQLAVGGDVYDWVGARTQKAFRDGKPSEIDTYWKAAGGVTKNGAPFGQYQLVPEVFGNAGGKLRFVLALPDTTVELESWNAY